MEEDVGKVCRRATVQTTSNVAPDLAKPTRAFAKKLTSAAAILSAGSGGADGRGIALCQVSRAGLMRLKRCVGKIFEKTIGPDARQCK